MNVTLPDKESYRTAVVNSSSFGHYCAEAEERLNAVGEVERLDVDPSIDGAELAKRLDGFDFVVASVTPQFPRSFFDNNDDVRLISRHGVGCDNVDLDAASEHGVIVTRVAKADERDAVAELSVTLIMACARHVKPACDAALDGRWNERAGFVGLELSAATVGVIGFGSIGSRVGEIMNRGFHSTVLAYDPYVSDEDIRSHGAEPSSLEEMLPRCDVLSFNAEHTGENYRMVGEKELDMLKDGAIVVNTARGELTDEEALASAARDGKVSAVGLDVCEQEPPPEDHPLLQLPNLVLLPHVGSYTHATLERMDRKMAEDVEAMLEGEFPDEVVNPKALEPDDSREDTL